ncbi:MAG: prepilin-type N-terminal cleavage/methylation domain-containing protein [Aestuariibacter sp.]
MNKAKIYRGFTLVELIVVIIILGIVSSGIFGFLSTGTQIYIDVTERDQILSESRFLVERLNREIRYALPNSVRVKEYPEAATPENVITHCLEFTPIEWSAFYNDVATGSETPTSSLQAPDMIGSLITSQQYDRTQADSHYVVIYPTQPVQVYSALNINGGRRVGLDGVSTDDVSSVPPDINPGDNLVTVYFDNDSNELDDPTAVRFATDSTVRRFYIVSNPISYCYNQVTGIVTRHTDYGFLPDQTAQTGSGTTLGEGILMAKNMINELSDDPNSGNNLGDPFRYSDPSLTRNAIVHLLLRFSRNDEVVVFNNEVHLRNVP